MAAAKIEEVGLLLVHGIGEQKKLEHLRCTAGEIASYVGSTAGLVRLGVDDRSETAGEITIDATFISPGSTGQRRVRLHCREVWWADLGISGGMVEEAAFWLWGLGQWAAQIAYKGRRLGNTTQLMDLPAFPHDPPGGPPGGRRQVPARFILFGAGVLALLTLVTWSLVKRVVSFVAGRIPDPSLIFLFLGDVKVYQQPGGPGRGTAEDPNMPRRATIRRRMVSEMIDMGSAGHDRWYVLAHSLGSVVAFNGLQETELALPNYLTEPHWSSIPAQFKTDKPYKPAGTTPTTKEMMPRRPPWLSDKDGISRKALFKDFAGLLTYGAPLDKYAALWPRIVCLNKQKGVFGKGCEWLNIYDPTDPVGASLEAFGKTPGSPTPTNDGCRASKAFLLSHSRYFSPRRRREKPMAGPIVDALLRGESLKKAASGAANPTARNVRRHLLALVEVAGLFAILSLAAAGLLLAGGIFALGKASLCKSDLISAPCVQEVAWTGLAVFGAAVLAVLVAGLLRMTLYDRWFEGK